MSLQATPAHPLPSNISYADQAIALSCFESKCSLPSPLTLLFIHGRGSSKGTWLPVLERLKDKYNIIAIDLRGHGDSLLDNVNISINYMIADIEKLVKDRLLTNFVLVAHSMGVRIAIPYAAKHPEQVKALVLVDLDVLPIPFEEISAEEISYLKEFKPEHATREEAEKEVQKYGPDKATFGFRKDVFDDWVKDGRIRLYKDGHVRIGINPYITYLTAKLISTSCETKEAFRDPNLKNTPMLLLKAEKNSCVSEDGLKLMQQNPLVTYKFIPNSKHSIHGDPTTNEFLTAVQGFLKTLNH